MSWISADWLRQWLDVRLTYAFDSCMLTILRGGLVNAPAFNGTFQIDQTTNAGTNMIALIVAIVSFAPTHAPHIEIC